MPDQPDTASSSGAHQDAPTNRPETTHGPTRAHEAAEYALLGLLREGPGHGYRLAAAFTPTGRLGLIVRLKMSQMYAYLHKLERQGWLVVTEDTADTPDAKTSGHMRRVFTLTPPGEHAFDTWLSTPVTPTREVRLTFLLKLAFALPNRALARELLARQRETTATWLMRLRAREAQVRARNGAADDSLVALFTLRQRIKLSEASLAWLDETAAMLATVATG